MIFFLLFQSPNNKITTSIIKSFFISFFNNLHTFRDISKYGLDKILSASTSSDSLITPITPFGSNSRLYKIPSLPKSRNKSGIPIPTIHRDLSQISALRGHFWQFVLFTLSQKKIIFQAFLVLMKLNIIHTGNVRSISALDTAAVQRARARQQYSTMARLKVTAGTASLRMLHFWNILYI